MDAAQFRTDFPAFANTTTYADGTVNFYLNLAALLLNATRFSTILPFATELFVAHNLVIDQLANRTAAAGGIPGLVPGALESKAIKDVRLSYDPNVGLETDAGHWNLTTYGTRFIQLAKMAGSGGVQLGAAGVGSGWPGAGEGFGSPIGPIGPGGWS